MDQKKRQRDVSDVVSEAALQDISISHDNRMSRRYLGYRWANAIVADKMEYNVNLRQIGMPCYVEISWLHQDAPVITL